MSNVPAPLSTGKIAESPRNVKEAAGQITLHTNSVNAINRPSADARVTLVTANQVAVKLMNKMNRDALVALDNLPTKYPDLQSEIIREDAPRLIGRVQTDCHALVRHLCELNKDKSCLFQPSVDADAFKKAVVDYLKAEYGVDGASQRLPGTVTVGGGDQSMEFGELTSVRRDASESTGDFDPAKFVSAATTFIDSLKKRECPQPLTEILRVNNEEMRTRMIWDVINHIGDRLPTDLDPNRFVDELSSYLKKMRNNELPNPFNLDVSSWTLVGAIPEAPYIFDSQQPESALAMWLKHARAKSPDGVGSLHEDDVLVGLQGCPVSDRSEELRGAVLIYPKVGPVRELCMAEDSIQGQIAAEYRRPNALEQPAGLYYYSERELKNTLVFLPKGRVVELHVHLREFKTPCVIYRDHEGKMVIEDERGNPPSELRGVDDFYKRLMTEPIFDHLSPEEMYLAYHSE